MKLTKAPVTARTFNFKNDALNEASVKIAEIANDISGKNIELARLLGQIKKDIAYKEDGFKSVAEYAETTFGIKRANAYQLAKVGERFLLAETETAKKVAGMLPASSLAELVTLSDDDINAQLALGNISTNSTQAQLRDVAKVVKDSTVNDNGKESKKPRFNATVLILSANGATKADIAQKTREEIEVAIRSQGYENSIYKTLQGEGKRDGHYYKGIDVYYNPENENVAIITYTRFIVRNEEPKKESKSKFTKEQLLEMLAQFTD